MRLDKFLFVMIFATLVFIASAIALNMQPQIERDGSELYTAKTLRNVIYGAADGVELKMNIYLPREARSKIVPVVLCVHGGAWHEGGKMSMASPVLLSLLEHGYAIASIDYRLAPEFKFPAQIEDCKCAVRFLRAHSAGLHIDRDRIGAMGESAGGHLVALLGLTDASAGFEGNGGWQNESSRVQAVADLFGPSDLTDWNFKGHKEYIWTAKNVFGAKREGDPVLERASPVNYISRNAPPFFILHGNMDNVVPISQSIELCTKLRAGGDSVTFLMVTNFGHGGAPFGLQPKPPEKQFARDITDFFDRTLKK